VVVPSSSRIKEALVLKVQKEETMVQDEEQEQQPESNADF